LEVGGEEELRPLIFNLAKERGWVLWELQRERATLEQIFRELTTSGIALAPEDPAGHDTGSALVPEADREEGSPSLGTGGNAPSLDEDPTPGSKDEGGAS
ncbi:MAG: hypothetical protein HKO53_09115, partial [Gemmatimonadetes bacterium]|nr:hypothetical protein [Gemmatimonadota bacterium]